MGCNCSENKKWECSDSSIDIALLEPELAKHAGSPINLIKVLQKAQELYGYLPLDLIVYISSALGVKPAKALGVVTFYTQFKTKPVGKHLILLCRGTACHVNGASGIEEAVSEYLGVSEGDITPNGLFSYNNVACLGCCSLSPVMMIDNKAYGNLTKDSAVKILKEIEMREASLCG
ncbi:MAG: NAD(P)H-dependent oxidoreductase subunit E [Eubacteriaceae bacterium]|nr:NAD(P)H-dependent oxidoreductase subunit E [Eubacteriaceae bacterium]